MSRPDGGNPPDRYESGRRPANGRPPSRSGGPEPERRSIRERAANFARGMTEQFGSVVENARQALQSRNRNGAGSGAGRRDYAPAGYTDYGASAQYSGYSGAMAAASPEQPEKPSQSGYRRSRMRLLARKWRLSRRNPQAIWAGVGFAVCGLLLAAILGSVAGGGYYSVSYYEANSAQIAAVAAEANQPYTTFYDRNGNVIYTMPKAGDVNVYLPYNSLSDIVKHETVSTEDRTFFDSTNIGIDWTSTARALLADISSGGASQGGSTITQQLVKNLVIDNNQKSIIRKIDEGILSVGITESGAYSKAKILEMYLDTIPYDENNIGIEAAAENYFGLYPYTVSKTDKDKSHWTCPDPSVKQGQTCWGNQQLDWAQAAMLVGIPNAPSIFFPTQWTTDCQNPKTDNCSQPSEWDNPCIKGVDPQTAPASACFDGTGNGPSDGYAYVELGHEWLSYRRAHAVLDSVKRDGWITNNQETSALKEVLSTLEHHQVYIGGGSGNSTFSASSAGSNAGQASSNASHQPSDSTANDHCGATKCAPHFIDYVLQELETQYGYGSLDAIEASGIHVYTTLDLALDTYAITDEQYYLDYPHQLAWPNYCNQQSPCPIDPPLSVSENIHNAAAVAMDPYTGDILAMVGSVDYTSKDPTVQGAFNVATSQNRSMGSSVKSIVYATAFQMGWNPGTMIQDAPVCFPVPQTPQTDSKGNPIPDPVTPGCGGAWYSPHNFESNSYSGTIPVRYAIANSLNVPATETMSFVGDSPYYSQDILTMAQRMGITSWNAQNMGPTTALGTQPVSLLQLTNAYGVFAADGMHVPPRSILEITFPNGQPPYIAPTPQLQPAISPQAAYMVTSILTDPKAREPDFNTFNPLEFDSGPMTWGSTNSVYYTPADDLDFPAIAAKTGTSQGIVGPRDIVTMGYSPYMALGIWAGNNDSSDIAANVIGIAGAGYIFHDIMQYAISHYKWPKGVQFPIPTSLALGTFNCTSGLAPYKDQPVPPRCAEHEIFKGSTGIWSGYFNQPQTDTDWYIKNLPWLQS